MLLLLGTDVSKVCPENLDGDADTETGSASQVVPAIVDRVKSVTQFVRVSNPSLTPLSPRSNPLSTLESSVLCADAKRQDPSVLETSLLSAAISPSPITVAHLLDSRDCTFPVPQR